MDTLAPTLGMRLLLLLSLAGISLAGFYDPSDGVVELKDKNFDKKVIEGEGAWIVEFYAPWCGHCKNFVPEFSKAARTLKGVVGVGAVDATEEKEVAARFGIKGFPTVKLFVGDKKTPIDYKGSRTAEGLAKALSDEVEKVVKKRLGGGGQSSSGSGRKTGSAVIELTDDNFEKLVLKSKELWLVEFFAPWCGHCKNLAPHWEEAAKKLKDKGIKLGALDATSQTRMAEKYSIKGFPTIKFFGPNGMVENYEGGRSASDIITYAEDKVSENAVPPEVKELVGEQSADEGCREAKTLCVLAFLPSLYDCDAKCRNRHIDTFKELAKNFRKQPWGWLWVEGVTQTDLEEKLDVGGFGYPALVALNAKKMRFSTFTGSFSKDGIQEFLRDLAFGKGRTVPLKEWPKLEKTEPWDGKDAKPLDLGNDKEEL